MKKIQQMNNIFQNLFKVRFWFFGFPFAITGFIFAFYFYLIYPFYMLFDLLKNEISSLLHADGDSSGTQVVKHLIGFGFFFFIGFLTACFTIILAVLYFLTAISFYLSSIGEFKTNPFAFHEINSSNE